METYYLDAAGHIHSSQAKYETLCGRFNTYRVYIPLGPLHRAHYDQLCAECVARYHQQVGQTEPDLIQQEYTRFQGQWYLNDLLQMILRLSANRSLLAVWGHETEVLQGVPFLLDHLPRERLRKLSTADRLFHLDNGALIHFCSLQEKRPCIETLASKYQRGQLTLWFDIKLSTEQRDAVIEKLSTAPEEPMWWGQTDQSSAISPDVIKRLQALLRNGRFKLS